MTFTSPHLQYNDYGDALLSVFRLGDWRRGLHSSCFGVSDQSDFSIMDLETRTTSVAMNYDGANKQAVMWTAVASCSTFSVDAILLFFFHFATSPFENFYSKNPFPTLYAFLGRRPIRTPYSATEHTRRKWSHHFIRPGIYLRTISP